MTLPFIFPKILVNISYHDISKGIITVYHVVICRTILCDRHFYGDHKDLSVNGKITDLSCKFSGINKT